MTDAPNPRITRHCDSIESLASMLTAAAQVGFRDVTVTTVKSRDRNQVPYTYYVLDLAERVEMRGEALPFPDSPITWAEFVDTEHAKADDEDRKRADHIAQRNTGFGAPRQPR